MTTLNNIYDDMCQLITENDIDKYITNYDYTINNITLDVLLFVAYDLFNYGNCPDILITKFERLYQHKFRLNLIKKYKSCIITGKDIDICEACHIIPYSDCSYNNKYDINNGLLLCKELHTLFDKYKFSFDNNCNIIMSDEILNKNTYREYHKYNGLHFNFNKDICNNLIHHYNKFIILNNIITSYHT